VPLAPIKDTAGRKPLKGKEKPAWRKDGADDRKPGKPKTREDGGDGPQRLSLRIGTGKKGRGAELNQRRGSLKKRDRTLSKEYKEEAAMERRTVVLPEYVY
jgi:hypothetical protein